MLEAGLWGLLAGSSLLMGAAIGIRAQIKDLYIGLLLGFGAGTLISALAFELTEDAFALGGANTVAAGLGAGALTYFIGNRVINRKDSGEGAGLSLLLGAVLDGIPESAVIGITLLSGTVSAPMVAAVFISNIPEALSSAAEMPKSDRRTVMRQWLAVTLVCGVAASLGYGLLDGASGDLIGFINAFAGGAVLMTVADAMLPDAQEKGGDRVGLLTVLGFALAYLLSTLD